MFFAGTFSKDGKYKICRDPHKGDMAVLSDGRKLKILKCTIPEPSTYSHNNIMYLELEDGEVYNMSIDDDTLMEWVSVKRIISDRYNDKKHLLKEIDKVENKLKDMKELLETYSDISVEQK